MKLCIDCIHFKQTFGLRECHHENNLTVSPIDGCEKSRHSIESVRAGNILSWDDAIYPNCGRDGLWYEAKGD